MWWRLFLVLAVFIPVGFWLGDGYSEWQQARFLPKDNQPPLVDNAPLPDYSRWKRGFEDHASTADDPELEPESSQQSISSSVPEVNNNSPHLAIVIDDIGHSLSRLQQFIDLGIPITFAIIPDLPRSKASARLIKRKKYESIIHLPMEPQGYPKINPGQGALLVSYSLDTTAKILEKVLKDFPYVVGMNNHMGSGYTHNEAHMQVVQSHLAARQLFFLDSKTSPSKTPRNIARHNSYPYLERDIFIDNDRNPKAIRSALDKAVKIAIKRGQAIAIGHPYPQTYRSMQRFARQELPISLVFLSALDAYSQSQGGVAMSSRH